MLSKVLGGATVILVIIIGLLWHQNGKLHTELGANKQALDQAAQTNRDNVADFDLVNLELTDCVEQIAIDKMANEVTVANLEARYARLEIRKDRIQIKREEIFRDPKCAELRNLDMAAICPDWAGELRDRAATIGGSGDTGEEGSGAGGPTG